MVFELVSWLYISLICFVWGNLVWKLFFGIEEINGRDFFVVCFFGLSVIGIILFYISLFMPFSTAIKLSLQIPALLTLIVPSSRGELLNRLRRTFTSVSTLDFALIGVVLLMILFLCTSPVIHPDTLNYHLFSTQLFDKYGSIKGIANLKPEFGFQSLWFAVVAFFDFSISGSGSWFPLNCCVLSWFTIFLISKAAKRSNDSLYVSFQDAIWYLVLLLISILSWTQIRLTASSLSPDFLAAISIILGFYFFVGKQEGEMKRASDLLAAFFSLIAVSMKLSAFPVLLIPLLIFCHALFKGKFLTARLIFFGVLLMLTPFVIRSIISTGYPFYPSSFSGNLNFDWKVEQSQVMRFQHYITSYARYPISLETVANEYGQSFSIWIPVWWRHLYLIDKAIMISVGLGILSIFLFFKTWIENYSGRMMLGFFIALAGVALWFIKAPDPRFGTGFLFPLIYFMYSPFLRNFRSYVERFSFRVVVLLKVVSTFFVLIYIGYRLIYFFQPSQLMFPEGINETLHPSSGCDMKIKRMVLSDEDYYRPPPDSCLYFRFRGATIKAGFKPIQ